MQQTVPSYLRDFTDSWVTDAKRANLPWWPEAGFGLFIHCGLYTQLGEGEWVQFRRPIPPAEYEKLAESFDPGAFDADRITDPALEAEMSYVNLVTCHHDSFCLWDSANEPFNSVRTGSGRDLVAEPAEACREKSLGFFTYYTFALNWRHPYYLSRDYFPMARPPYDYDEPRYKLTSIADFDRYLDYVRRAITELLTAFGPLAGMWLDLIMAYYARPDLIPAPETYALVRELQPHALVSFKQGATGEEDFATPEQHFHSLEERAGSIHPEDVAALKAVGKRIRSEGRPTEGRPITTSPQDTEEAGAGGE